MSSHREISPKQRERMGIRDGVRLSVGIGSGGGHYRDLEQALLAARAGSTKSAKPALAETR